MAGVAWSGTGKRRSTQPRQVYLKFEIDQWKSSGHLVCDLGRLKLTVVTGQFGHLYRQLYRKVSKQTSVQSSK